MVKVLGWIVILVIGLFVGGVIAILAGGDERRQAVADSLRGGVMELSDEGQGYHDGRRVWSTESPCRITIEQLPSLEGRRLGSSYNSGFLTARMSWFGISLRDALARALDVPSRQVEGDAALDSTWLDVDAARAGGVFGNGINDWDEVNESILAGLLEGYDLTVSFEPQLRPHIAVVAGPGWAAHEQSRRRGRTRSTSREGWLELEGPVSQLLNTLGQRLDPVAETEGLDTSAWLDLELSWDANDPRGLQDALAEQLDLHVTRVEREVVVVRVAGTPRASFER